jgi:XTP/dITP diphosphohydrolase
VDSLRDFPRFELPPESGSTYLENAAIKARAAHLALGLPSLGDDSGLEVDALAGAPGIRSARYAGLGATDEGNIRKLLAALEGVPEERRTARFRCVLVLAGVHEEITVEGACEGRILAAPRGAEGFGYDPIFLPESESLSFSQLAAEWKDRLSHRGRAVAALIESLRARR